MDFAVYLMSRNLSRGGPRENVKQKMVGRMGVEPTTNGLKVRCSPLSFRPEIGRGSRNRTDE